MAVEGRRHAAPPRAALRAAARGGVAALVFVAAAVSGLEVHAQTAPKAATLQACAACHGPDGNSPSPKVPSLAAQPRLFIENQLVIMREGLRDVSAMKCPLQGITDEEISALARYYEAQTLKPPAVTVRPALKARGAELSQRALCGTCHLADYTGQRQVPRLAGQHEAYTLASLKHFRDAPGPGRDTLMAATLLGMTDDDLAALAHYFAIARP